MDFPHWFSLACMSISSPSNGGDRYEDPLQATLERMEIGRVTGGGSQLDELGGITFAGVEIELANVDEAVRIVAEALGGRGGAAGFRAHPGVG